MADTRPSCSTRKTVFIMAPPNREKTGRQRGTEYLSVKIKCSVFNLPGLQKVFHFTEQEKHKLMPNTSFVVTKKKK